jgi:hypothetical protein
MNAVELNKVSTPSRKPTPVLRSSRQYPRQYVAWVKPNTKRNVREILNGIWEILFSTVFMDNLNFQMFNCPEKIDRFYKKYDRLPLYFPGDIMTLFVNRFKLNIHGVG